MIERETYFCENCAKPFSYKRTDQKHCSDSCRFEFNNMKKKENLKKINPLIKKFILNYKLLSDRASLKRRRPFYSLSLILQKGFDMNCIHIPYYSEKMKLDMKQVGDCAFWVNEEETMIWIIKIDD